jgi:hypothetical protein
MRKLTPEIEQWLQARKDEGLRIDPETAEVTWTYAQTLDPYGIYGDLPEECRQVGREYFARSPGREIWVHFHDLPDETREKLWQMHRSELAFPAGLPFFGLTYCRHIAT